MSVLDLTELTIHRGLYYCPKHILARIRALSVLYRPTVCENTIS